MLKHLLVITVVLTCVAAQALAQEKSVPSQTYQKLEIKVVAVERWMERNPSSLPPFTPKPKEGNELIIIRIEIIPVEPVETFVLQGIELTDADGAKYQSFKPKVIRLSHSKKGEKFTSELHFETPRGARPKRLKVETLSFDIERLAVEEFKTPASSAAPIGLDPQALESEKAFDKKIGLITLIGISETAQRLEPDKPIERKLAVNQPHTYRITLAAAQRLKVMAEQRGIDLVLTLLGPDGLPLAEVDSPNDRLGEEPLWWVAKEAGSYSIVASALEAGAPPGRYDLKIAELGAATPADDKRVEAQRLFTEGSRLLKQDTPESLRQAVAKYQESSELWRVTGERSREGNTLFYIGRAYRRLGEKQKELDHYRQALPLWRAVGNRHKEAETLCAMGIIYLEYGDWKKALDCARNALDVLRAAGNRGEQAKMLNILGGIYFALGERKKAVDSLLEGLELWRSLGEQAKGNEIETLVFLNRIYLALGDKQRAHDYYLQSLELKAEAQEADDRTLVIILTDDQGQILFNGSVIKKVEPPYPPEAKAARVSGSVRARITISEKGKVIEAVVAGGPELLREAALTAARQWVFEPLLLRGTPVKVQGILTFNFVLE